MKLSVLMLISPIFDLFSFSVILYILNTAIQQNRVSLELIFFSGCMGGASLIKGFFELYKCYIQNRFINFSAQRISVKIFELFEKEDLQEHNKKSPMQALAIVREDTANCMSVLSGSVSLLISGFTLAVFCGCLIWISRALGIAVCLGMIGFMAMMYLQNRLRMMRFGEERRQCIIKSSAQITTAFGMFKETKIDSRADVPQMPQGIDTLIGENGMIISGGQRQRIALARALYKDFEILVMDEATAALDMETEKAVLDSVRQVKGNKTLLMVTHHRSLADACELVYKIENRKIVRVR